MSDRGKPWWVLQDGGGDVAALVETPTPGAQAVVAAQWTYDAYGSCLTAEHLRAYPLVHCGHKALFFDRLDVGVVGSSGDEIARLAPYAHAVYQVRNRAYAPALGRFYQRDPNATAMALIEVSAYHGRGLGAIVSAFSMESLYGDGANLYQYLGGNPWTRHDPLGLFFSGIDIAALGADVVMRGLRGGLENMLEAYASNMEDDLDWAADWSQPDDWHTRLDNSWVSESFNEGMVEGIRGAVVDFVDPFGLRHLPDLFESEPQAGVLSQAYRVARSVARVRPAVRLALQAATRLRLVASTSAAEIANVFKRLAGRCKIERIGGFQKTDGLGGAKVVG